MDQKDPNINIEETIDVNNDEIAKNVEKKSISDTNESKRSVTQVLEQSPSQQTNTISSANPETPPALTEAFYKSRRSYGFFCAILFGWILLGIEVKGDELPYIKVLNTGAIIYVVLTLLVYFSFRTSVEWYQCHLDRREQVVSSIDFFISHVIGILVLLLYISQYLGLFNVADFL